MAVRSGRTVPHGLDEEVEVFEDKQDPESDRAAGDEKPLRPIRACLNASGDHVSGGRTRENERYQDWLAPRVEKQASAEQKTVLGPSLSERQ